jgi:Tfp pilus assembly protein PilF
MIARIAPLARSAGLCTARAAAAAVTVAALLGACAAPEVPPPTVSVAALLQQPAERALADGLRDYEAGTFDAAEHDFQAALDAGLRDRRDSAVAHKNLAFIACAFNRLAECERQFRSAFAADPGFHLSDAEVGHPIWGPVYRRVAASVAPAPH